MFRNQDLKNQDVEFKEHAINAKGVIKINNLNIIYRYEYDNTKLNNDIVNVTFIIPSNVNTSIEEVSIDIFVFIDEINSLKHIL